MSVTSEECGRALRQWKKSLNARLEEWLIAHPEPEEPRLLPAPPVQNDTVKVLPTSYGDGGWVVYKNNQVVCRFFGVGSWAQASKFANDLINGDAAEGEPQ